MRENRTCGSEGGEAQSLPYPYPAWPFNNCSFSTINYQLSTINYQLSIINYQLSIINYQLSIINYQLSIINYQLFIVHYQLGLPSGWPWPARSCMRVMAGLPLGEAKPLLVLVS